MKASIKGDLNYTIWQALPFRKRGNIMQIADNINDFVKKDNRSRKSNNEYSIWARNY